ncbi:hypothetical protein TTHERM_00690000 (macronuclear) [Tetrahymena thermophila SB210]|uniref:Uncharacterized protein n=1 Tax=Tetrahymena thermophila (strain SB210) TaxID=312017 RepID=I7MJL8_TETTS|nr:hypothetical protein TTHERM_00690000 [Tetrahymena thermophila SB210]EAS06761.1 hypothetical protein TTHERM_00690000 [Tetrahymena thermophila SB210]|eukprot:XP_001027003.1 hypothetical protein TTHERM_00690000 [Tetrahymena thermophila SB210]
MKTMHLSTSQKNFNTEGVRQQKNIKLTDKIHRPKSQTASQKRELSKEDFKSFLENLSSKYQTTQPFAKFQGKSDILGQKQPSNNQKGAIFKANADEYQEIQEDYDEDFESDYVDSQMNSNQHIHHKNKSTGFAKDNYIQSKYENKDAQLKQMQTYQENEQKGFYSKFIKFNENPDQYFKLSEKDKLKNGQFRSNSRDKREIKQQLNLPNKQNFYQLQYALTTYPEQGKKNFTLPSKPTANTSAKHKQENQKQQQNQYEIMKQQTHLIPQSSQEAKTQQGNDIQPIINMQYNKNQDLNNKKINTFPNTQLSSPSNNNNNDNDNNYITPINNGQVAFRIRKSDSATLRHNPKQAFFKNIQQNINKNPSEKNTQIIKNSNILINDVFKISDKESQSEQKAVEGALFIEIQNLKVQKNEIIQENNQVREKIINLERDIKQMSRQLNKWNIESRMVFDEAVEPYIDSQSCDKVYEDPNFYLTSLRKKVKEMKQEINQLDEQIKEYNDTLRNIRTDLRAEQRQTEMEKQLMIEYQLYREKISQIRQDTSEQPQDQRQAQKNNQNEKKELIKERDQLLKQIQKVKDDNKTIMIEISLQMELQEENDAQIAKLEKKAQQRHQKLNQYRQEIIDKSPEDLQKQKIMLKQKNIQMEEEKKIRNADQQNSLIQIQFEKLNSLKFDFQEFRRKQILENQQSNKQNQELDNLIQKLKSDYIKVQSQIIKKKKILKNYMLENQHDNLINADQLQHLNLQDDGDDYQLIDEEDMTEEQLSRQASQKKLNSRKSSKNPSYVQFKQSKGQNNLISLAKIGATISQQSLAIPQQSLCSTDQGNYGESQKSKYNNDEPISIIYGVQTIEV